MTEQSGGNHEVEGSSDRCSKRRKLESVVPGGSADLIQIFQRDHGRIRGRRGRLKLMTEMPFDILYEIFGELEPIDLLHLSWSTRTLHGMIMGKDGRFLWKNAFARLYASDNPPPKCPSDLNFAQYTHFLFGKRCMVCQINLGRNRSWAMRLRICRHCLRSERFISVSKRSGEPGWWGLATIVSSQGRFCLRSERDQVQEKTQSLSGEPLLRFQDEREKQKESKIEGTEDYRGWVHSRRNERRIILWSLRDERRKAILRRLDDMGWKDPNICEYAIFCSSECSKPKPLTDREWNTLQPLLVRLLEEGKIRRREKIIKRLKILQGRIERSCEGPCKNLDDDERPFAEDIAVLEPFKSTIFRHTDEDPKCLSMNDLAFAQILVEWHQERRQFILSLLPNDLTEDTGGNKVPDTLALEAVYFRGGCDNAIQYYYHTMCRFRQWQTSGEMPGDAPRELCLLNAGDFRRPWNWDRARWSFDSERYTVTITMLKYLGMDPRTTTPAEFLLDCDLVRLHCILCDTAEPVLHNCWSAMKHELEHHKDALFLPGEMKWQKVE